MAVTIEQQQKTVFEFPLDLNFITGLRKNKGEKLLISKKTETFYFSVTGPVVKVEADHTTSLLSEISIQQVY